MSKLGEELEQKLKNMLDTVVEMKEVLIKSKEIHEDVPMTTFYKKMEDGILDKIGTANDYQKKVILESYKFRYYTTFNTDKDLLKRVITEKIRGSKLEELLND